MAVCRYSCDCTATGYYGDRCEHEIDECDSSPCQHNATCVDQLMVCSLALVRSCSLLVGEKSIAKFIVDDTLFCGCPNS